MSNNFKMKNINDIIGMCLGEARTILYKNGYEIDSVNVTAKPYKEKIDVNDSFRVIKISLHESNRVSILVCDPL